MKYRYTPPIKGFKPVRYYPPKGKKYVDAPDLLYYEWDGRSMWRVRSWCRELTSRTVEQMENGTYDDYTIVRQPTALGERFRAFARRCLGLDSENAKCAGTDASGKTL